MVLERWRPRTIRPWDPLREMEEWERLWPSIWRRFPAEEIGWTPAIDVYEKEDKFVIKAELPGMKQEDIDVSIVGDTLTIRGEKKTESEVKEEDYYRSERHYGSFFRSIPLPSSVDAKKIEATYEDGVLEVVLPKAPEVKAKKLAITAKREPSKTRRTRARKEQKASPEKEEKAGK